MFPHQDAFKAGNSLSSIMDESVLLLHLHVYQLCPLFSTLPGFNINIVSLTSPVCSL